MAIIYCTKHKDFPKDNWGGGARELQPLTCAVCDLSIKTLYKTVPLLCHDCSVNHKLCRACGKELEFDNEAQ